MGKQIDSKYVNGATRLATRIETIVANANIVIASQRIPNLLAKRTLERFEREVDPDGTPWVPLAPSTLRSKARYPGTKILQRTFALRDAIGVIQGSSQGLLAASTGAGMRIGVRDTPRPRSEKGKLTLKPTEYGRYHQFGLGRVPQRRFLGVGRLDVKAVDSLLRREIAKKSGLK